MAPPLKARARVTPLHPPSSCMNKSHQRSPALPTLTTALTWQVSSCLDPSPKQGPLDIKKSRPQGRLWPLLILSVCMNLSQIFRNQNHPKVNCCRQILRLWLGRGKSAPAILISILQEDFFSDLARSLGPEQNLVLLLWNPITSSTCLKLGHINTQTKAMCLHYSQWKPGSRPTAESPSILLAGGNIPDTGHEIKSEPKEIQTITRKLFFNFKVSSHEILYWFCKFPVGLPLTSEKARLSPQGLT